MKKIIYIVLICVVIAGAAVGGSILYKNKSVNDDEINNTIGETEKKEEDDVSSEETNKKDDDIEKDTFMYEIPMEGIYFNYPNTLTYYQQSYTRLLYNSKDALVGICSDFATEYIGTDEAVFKYLIDHFLNDASTTSRANLFDAVGATEILSSEKVMINGFESYKVRAEAKPNEESSGEYMWPCHLYGYTFVIDNTPCAVIGIVSTEEQEAELIKEYDALVDQIAGTIRTTP